MVENTTAVTDVDTTDDSDSEGSGLTYSLSTLAGGGTDNGSFSIDSSSGVLIFNSPPDFGNPTDAGANNVYDVQVTVTDSGGLTDVQDIAVTVTIDGAFRRTRTQRVISNFIGRRADQITANEPDLVERLTRGGSTGGGDEPIGFTANGTADNYQLAFSTSLGRIAGEANRFKPQSKPNPMMAFVGEAPVTEPESALGKAMAYGEKENGQQEAGQSGSPRPGFDIWVKGKWAHVEDETRKSDIGLVYVGVDYLFNPSLLVGVLAQFDWMDEKDATEGIAVDGKGWMAGPYVVARVRQSLLFDGRVAWGQSANNVSPFGTYTDGFDTDRWLARAQLTGDFRNGNWLFAPHVGVIYFEEKQKAYTDSLGIPIRGQTISLGRVTFGPKVSYLHRGEDGAAIEPYVEIKGIWDFDNAEIVDLSTGLPTGSSDNLRARLEGGLSIRVPNGMLVSGATFYDGIGASDFEAYGGQIKATVPFN